VAKDPMRFISQQYYKSGARGFDGANDYARAPTTGLADSDKGTIFFTYRKAGGDGLNRNLVCNDSSRFTILHDNSNELRIVGRADTNNLIFSQHLISDLTDLKWHTCLIAYNLSLGSSTAIVDGSTLGAEFTTAISAGAIDHTRTNLYFGARAAFNDQFLNDDVGAMYLNFSAAADLTDQSIVDKFYTSDRATLHLGDTGEIPTGAQPAVYMPSGDPTNNLGSHTSTYSLNGALTTVSGPARFYTTDDATYYDGTDRQRQTTLTGVTNGKVAPPHLGIYSAQRTIALFWASMIQIRLSSCCVMMLALL
jgi:hypothetical protein